MVESGCRAPGISYIYRPGEVTIVSIQEDIRKNSPLLVRIGEQFAPLWSKRKYSLVKSIKITFKINQVFYYQVKYME